MTVEDLRGELARRRLGYGRGPRMRFEQDEVTIIGGIRHGRTLGSPVAIEIGNSEWVKSDKWHEEVRFRRRARRARAGIGARDRSARRRWCAGEVAAGSHRRVDHLARAAD